MSIIDDFKDINRRLNRKPEPAGALCKPAPVVVPPEFAAALDWTQELTKLWDYLDNNDTVFIGFDTGSGGIREAAER